MKFYKKRHYKMEKLNMSLKKKINYKKRFLKKKSIFNFNQIDIYQNKKNFVKNQIFLKKVKIKDFFLDNFTKSNTNHFLDFFKKVTKQTILNFFKIINKKLYYFNSILNKKYLNNIKI